MKLKEFKKFKKIMREKYTSDELIEKVLDIYRLYNNLLNTKTALLIAVKNYPGTDYSDAILSNKKDIKNVKKSIDRWNIILSEDEKKKLNEKMKEII